MTNKQKNKKPVLVIDSGVGGLTTLAILKKHLPDENFIFFADHKNAPYGDKTEEEVKKLVYNTIKLFDKKGIKALIIACNTAVSASIEFLRKQFDFPILGLEPAVKLAFDKTKDKNIIVMATKLTIEGKKLNNLIKKLDLEDTVKKISAPGLVELIENNDKNAITQYLKNLFKNTEISKYSSIVLGCTHYIYLKEEIFEILGKKIKIFDGNEGITLHLKNILEKKQLINTQKESNIKLLTSGNDKDLKKMNDFFKKALNSINNPHSS